MPYNNNTKKICNKHTIVHIYIKIEPNIEDYFMKLKTLQIGTDLREHFPYSCNTIPLTVCIDNFDDYFHKEWGCHWHNEIEFGIVQNGIVQFTIFNRQEQFCKEIYQGDGIFINSGCLHSAKALVPKTVIAEFALPITFFQKPFENSAYQIVQPVIESAVTDIILKEQNIDDKPLLSSIQEICSITNEETGYELHFIEMVCRIWRLLTIRILQNKWAGQIPVTNRVQEQRMKQMLSFIHAHYSKCISIGDIAKFAAISRTECFRCFRTILKKSPTEYLTEYRLSMAAMLLANTDRSLSDISISCGFNSPSYFGKLFREQCGLSPKKYREYNCGDLLNKCVAAENQ